MQEDVRLLSDRAVGDQIHGAAAEIDGIDGVRLNEGVDAHSLVALRANLVQLFGVDHDELALGELVAGDDGVGRDFAVDRASLLILDPVMALGVDLVEMDLAAATGCGGVAFDRDGNETEPEEALPAGARGHERNLPHLANGACAWGGKTPEAGDASLWRTVKAFAIGANVQRGRILGKMRTYAGTCAAGRKLGTFGTERDFSKSPELL